MATFEDDRAATALIVIDVQNGVVDGAFRSDAVVGNIAVLVQAAKQSGVPVVWVQHSDDELVAGSADWDYVPELAPLQSGTTIHKHHGDAFEGTRLASVLAELGVGHIIVAGAETDACIRSTIHGAFTRGYDVTLVADAHTAGDKTAWGAPPVEAVVAHTNLYWGFQTAPGKKADVLTTDQVKDNLAI